MRSALVSLAICSVLVFLVVVPVVPLSSGVGSGRLAPPHADAAEDRDLPADGLYNLLRVDVGVDITNSWLYVVAGGLWDPTLSSMIDGQAMSVDLTPGRHTISLFFSGVIIRERGIDGPYVVVLYLSSGTPGTVPTLLDTGSYTTNSYLASQFQSPTATVQGAIRDARTSAPIILAGAEAYNYRDETHIVATLTGPSGAYTLNLYPGDWALTYDAYGYQSAVRNMTVTGPVSLPATYLPTSLNSPVTYWLNFSTWRSEQSGVKAMGVEDNATFRLFRDWAYGNRDRTFVIEEFNHTLAGQWGPTPLWGWYAGLPPKEDSRDEFTVDGNAFALVPGSEAVHYRNMAGPVENPLLPEIERNVSRSNAVVPPADTHGIAVNVIYESPMSVGFTSLVYYVQLPPSTILTSYTPKPAVTVTDLGTGLIKVDPGVPSDASMTSTWVTLYAFGDADPPTIASPRALPDPAELGQATTVEANVTDPSGVASVNVLIWDPAGTEVGNGTMSRGSGDIYRYPVGSAMVGNYTFDITAVDSVGNAGTVRGTFAVQDTTPPTITSVVALPNPVELGQSTNVEARIADLGGVGSVVVEIRDPDGTEVGNYTMNLGAPDFYSYTFLPRTVGTYALEVTAFDESGNPSVAIEGFLAQDTTLPVITSLSAIPNPAELRQLMSLEANVMDVGGLASVSVEIEEPGGLSIGTFAMVSVGGDNYRYAYAPTILGTYRFTVTAIDVGAGIATDANTFSVRDTIRPTANAGPDVAVPEHTLVTLDGSASADNDRIANYTWSLDDRGGKTLYGEHPAYRFDRTGTFAVALTVRDPSGNQAVDTVRITVTPTTGAIRLIVRDQAGAPIPGATVRLLAGSTEVATATTNASGGAEFHDVEPGTFTIRVELSGFDAKTDTVSVAAGQSVTKEISLARTGGASPMAGWAVPAVIAIAIAIAILLVVAYAIRKRSRRADGPRGHSPPKR